MTDEQIIEMAKKLGFERMRIDHDYYLCFSNEIVEFAKLVAQHEQGEPLKDMSEMNRTIAYCAASKLREIGYEWDGKNWVQKAQEPVGWISNKDFEPIRIRIMQEAYELADSNNPEGYNAIKVMCGDVQKMLSPQRTWVGLTEEDVWNLLRFRKYNTVTIEIARAVEAKLKEKNFG